MELFGSGEVISAALENVLQWEVLLIILIAAAYGILVGAIPGLEIQGKVASIVPRANGQSRTFPARIRIPNDKARLGAGMVARVHVTSEDERSALIVPKDSIVTRGSDRFVYVLQEDATAKPVPVETGESRGDWVSVNGPLQVGDKVITRGNERLRPGQRLAATEQVYPAP